MVPPLSSGNVPSSKSSSSFSEPRLRFHFLTLFPEVFQAVLGASLLGKAQSNGIVSYTYTQIRDFAIDRHRTVDDTPYGGGEGMVLKADVLYSAWKSALSEEAGLPAKSDTSSKSLKTITLLMSPQGRLFDQAMARELASQYSRVIILCGHYEGLDERFIDQCVDREVSVGDYVLTGGELPAMVIADAVTRLLPGVVGNQRSITQDSLEEGLLKYPQYTRPGVWEGREVPPVLLSGNHQAIATWRRTQMEERTARKRPDLWEKLKKGNPKT